MSSGDSSTTRFVPRVEGLEDRVVPAGNVWARVFDGTLYIAGDDAGNQIQITGLKDDRVTLHALDATTTINGQHGDVPMKDITRDLYIRMYGGDDVLIIDGTSNHGTLNIDTGDGNDILGISGVNHGGASILATGAGDDTAILNGFNAHRYLFLDTGAGDDQVTARNVGALNFGLMNPSGNDFFDNQNSTFTRPAMIGFTNGTRPAPTTPTPDPDTTNTDNTNTDNTNTNNTNTDNTNTDNTNTNNTNTDTTPPTATVSAATTATHSSPVTFAINFSEDVTDFDPTDPADLLVTNGIVTSFTAFDAQTYTVQVAPSADGTVTATVAAGAAIDAAKNGNLVSNTVSVTFDTVAPTVTTNALLTSDTTPTLTGTVSEPGSTVQVTVNNKTYTATVTGTTWSANVTDALPNSTFSVTATATDPAGNVGAATPVSLQVDNTPPTITFTSNPGVPTNQSPVTVQITFSEPVTGFDISDISVANGVKSNFQTTPGNPRLYTVDVSPAFDGTVTVVIPDGAAQDAAGNPSEGLNFAFVYDTTLPTVSVNPGPGDTGKITGISADMGTTPSGVQKVEISIQNGSGGLFYTGPANGFDAPGETFLLTTSTDGFATWSFPLTTGQYVPGTTYLVNAKVTDNAGNVTMVSQMVTVA